MTHTFFLRSCARQVTVKIMQVRKVITAIIASSCSEDSQLLLSLKWLQHNKNGRRFFADNQLLSLWCQLMQSLRHPCLQNQNYRIHKQSGFSPIFWEGSRVYHSPPHENTEIMIKCCKWLHINPHNKGKERVMEGEWVLDRSLVKVVPLVPQPWQCSRLCNLILHPRQKWGIWTRPCAALMPGPIQRECSAK